MEIHPLIDAFAIHFDTFAGDVYTITDSSITLTNGTLTTAALVATTADINAGTVDAITSLTVANDIDIGNFDIRALSGTFDSLTSGRVPFASTNGLLVDDGDFTFATDTLTVTKIGAFEAAGAINFANQNMTNVDIDSGTVDAITSLTVANNVDIGNFTLTANGITIDGTFTDGTASIASGSITSAVNGTFSGTVQALTLKATDLTAGRVVFCGSDGASLDDDADLFWDDTNKRLGIGDTTPDARLDILGLTPGTNQGNADDVLIALGGNGCTGVAPGNDGGDGSSLSFQAGDGGPATPANGGSGGNITLKAGTFGSGGSGQDSGVITLIPRTEKTTAFARLVIGEGGVGADYGIKFIGQSSTGIIDWMEDEDYFNFVDKVKTSNGLMLKRYTANVSNPPTDAELDSAIGAPSAVGEGYTAIVDDNDAGANVYLVVSTGTDADKWWILTLTQAS